MNAGSLTARLCSARANGVFEADAEVLADVLWLVAVLGPGEPFGASRGKNTEKRGPPAEPSHQEDKVQQVTQTGGQGVKETGDVRSAVGEVPVYPELAPDNTSRTVSASFLSLPAGDPLAQRHKLERAFKPFKRRLASRLDKVLDPVATAERSAEHRAITPVYRAARERWFDVALITDASDGMHIWKESLEALQRLLTRHGAFRQVRLWRYTVHAGNLSLVSNSGYAVPPRSIADPQGRRIFIFLTNGTSQDWSSSALVDYVDLLGHTCPTAIVQMMPRRAWPHTTLGDALAQTWSATPGEATKRLRVRNRFTGVNEVAPNALNVPVLPMEANAVAQWAQFLMGPRRTGHLAVKLQRKAMPATSPDTAAAAAWKQADGRENSPSATRRVNAFRSIASAQAYQLIRLMAGVPLSLPVIRLLHASMSGERKQSDLAEVLLSGLIERGTPPEIQADPDTVQYEFKPGVRDALLKTLSADETRTIDVSVKSMRAQAERYVAEHAGSPHEFLALVPDAAGRQTVSQSAESFIDLSEKIFRQMYPEREISQVKRTGMSSDEGPVASAVSPFYSERRIVAALRGSRDLQNDERVTGTLLIFSTATQHTWLIATTRALLFVLDDESTRATGKLVNRTSSWFDAMPVNARNVSGTANVRFGAPKNAPWFYSPKLFPVPESLEFEVGELAPGGSSGPLQRLGALARQYENIRETMKASDRRTAAMTRVVEDMRKFMALRSFDLGMAVDSEFLGTQLGAVVSLQEHFQPMHIGWLAKLLVGNHAFLAFQAAAALKKAVPQLDALGRRKLHEELQDVRLMQGSRGLADPNVRDVLDGILRTIDAMDTDGRSAGSSPDATEKATPLRWVLVAGTGRPAEALSPELQTACKALGHELARAGFGLLTGGWEGVDAIVGGRFVDELDSRADILAERFVQYITPQREPLVHYGKIVSIRSRRREYSEPIEQCDAVILLGGLGGTLQMGQMARDAGRLVLPIAATGGDAEKLHSIMRGSKVSGSSGLTIGELDALARPLPGAVYEAIRILRVRMASRRG